MRCSRTRFVYLLQVPLSEFEFSWTKISDIQSQVGNKLQFAVSDVSETQFVTRSLPVAPQLEKLIEKNYYLHKSAQEAYKSYVRAYDSHSLKQIYDVNTLNLPMVALSFGFTVPPYVDLSILCCLFLFPLL